MRTLLFILALFTSINSFSQQTADNCFHFKTGKFSYSDSVGVVTKITRTNNRQTEVNTQTGLLTKSKISWISKCEYKLTQIWANRKVQRKNNRQTRTIRIVKTDGNSYAYTCNCNDPNMTILTGVVVKTGN